MTTNLLLCGILAASLAAPFAGLAAAQEEIVPASVAQPMHKDARTLYEIWQRHARANGDIPGAMVGGLAEAVKTFIGYHPNWETVPQLEKMLPRLDASHDWAGQDVVALLDELAVVRDSPINIALDREEQGLIRTGSSLPPELADAPWGEALPNGLRHAWLLEPRTAEHRLGTSLKARVLIHNSGKAPVVFRTRTWQQTGYKATDATGAEIKTAFTLWNMRGMLLVYRLAPGEFIEVSGPGIGVGPVGTREDWQQARVDTWIQAKAGEEVTVTTAPLPLYDWGEEEQLKLDGEPRWWLDFIKARLSRHLPFPAGKDARERLLYRVAMELFGTPYDDAAFVADTMPGALDALALRSFKRVGQNAWAGPLTSGPTKFRVLAADANAEKQPRVVLGPGEYPLPSGTAERGDATLKIVGRPVGDRHTNDAQLIFEATEFTGKLPPDPHKLEVPDGWGTWAIVCRPGDGFFYLLHKGGVRKIDYSAPRKVTDTPANDLPVEFRDEVKRQLEIAGVPDAQQAEIFEKPAPPAAADPKAPGTATTPEPRKAEAPAKTEGNLVNARATSLPGVWAMAGGVSLHIYGEVNHGSDVDTAAILSWPALGNRPAQHWSTWIAGDVFAARSLYAVAWDAQHAVLWIASRDVGSNANNGEGKPIANRFKRVDFSNPHLITETSSNGWPMEHPPSAEVMAQMATLMEVPQDQQPKASTLYSWSTSGNPERINLANVQNLSVQTDRAGTLTVSLQSEKKTCTENELAQTIKALALDWEMKRASTVGELKPTQRVTISTSADISAEALQKIIQGCTKANFGPLASGTGVPPDAPAPKSAEAGPRADDTALQPEHEYPKVGVPLAEQTWPMPPWGAEKDGLSAGLRVIGDARIGGEVKAELWVRNSSAKDVKFAQSPRADVGLHVGAKDKDGKEHSADITQFRGYPVYSHLLLPPGHGVKVKEFSVKFGAGKNDKLEPGWVNLQLTPGDYKLRAVWSDTTSRVAAEGEWTGKLTTGEVDLKIAARDATKGGASPGPGTTAAQGKWPPVRKSGAWSEEFLAHSKAVAEARGTPDAKPEDLIAWGAEEDGLRTGLLMAPRVTLGGQLPTRMVLRNVSGEAKELGLSISLNRLDASARTPDENVLMVRKVVLFGNDASYQVTLKPNEQVEFEGPPVQFGVEYDEETKTVKTPKFPICGVETGEGKVRVHFNVKAKTGEAVVEVSAVNKGADAGKPAAESPGADIIKFPDAEYAKDGFPLDELAGEGVMWNGEESGLSLGYRITGDEWRILGKEVKVERWVRNAGKEDVKFQILGRTDEGLRVKLTGKDGKEHLARMVPNDVPLFAMKHLLSPGQCIKVNDFSVGLLPPEQNAQIGNELRFFVSPGWYQFVCEVEVPGFTATGGGGKQFTPAVGEWTGKLSTRSVNVRVIAPDAPRSAAVQPKHKYAQKLFLKWQASARTDGKIPGALIGHVAREVDNFLKQYPDDEKTPKLAALRPRLDASRDWAQAEVVALLDDITAISTAPVSWADIPMEFDKARAVQGGKPLPKELESAAWGAPAANGLRAAWLLEPAPRVGWAQHVEFLYPLGSVLKARVLFHNAGKTPIFFQTEAMHQHDEHNARDAKGAAIKLSLLSMSGESRIASFRLAPGEYSEVTGGGIAIGARAIYEKEFSVGSYFTAIEAVEGDEVRFSSTVEAIHGDWSRPGDPKDPLEFWKQTIAERIVNEAPMPASAADREQLIRRVTLDVFGVVPTAEETAAFTADNAPDALAKLTARLQAKPRVEPFAGKLPTGETKFRVIAADPNAAKAPRTATGPGRYVLGDGVHLQITQTTVNPLRGGDFVPFLQDKATIIFPDPKPEAARGAKPHEIALPNGSGTYGIVWERGAGALWVLQKDLARKYDFTDPWKVQETRFAEGGITNIPEHLREAMKKAFDVPGAPVQKQMPVKPNGAAEKPAGAATPKLPKLPEDAYAKPGVHFDKFREEDAKRPGGERMGAVLEPSKPEDRNKEPLVLGVRTASDAQWRIGGTAKVGLVVRNRSDSDVKFSYTGRLDNGLSVVAVDEAGKEHVAAIAIFDGEFAFQQMLLPVAHVATIKQFTIRFDAEKRDVSEPHVAAFHLPPGKYKLRCKWNDARPEVAHEGEWTGELVNEELAFTLAAAAPPPAAATEKPTTAGAKLAPETEAQFDWGEAVNGLRAAVVVRSPQPGATPGIFLAVQNVSTAALRFTDSMAAKEQRKLYLSDSEGILAAFTSSEATKTDAVLPPRGVLFLPMFPSDLEKKGEAALIEGIRKDSLQTWRAVLNIQNAQEGAWKGKLTTGETRCATTEGPQPKSKEARALFKLWQDSARLNGDIPGGLLARLHDKMKEFIRNNTGDASGDPYAKKMAPLEPRFGPAGDWKPADVVALLDDIAAVTTIPLETTLRHHGEHTLRHGQPLPAALEKADWGKPLDGGLRMAYLLEARAAEYHLGTEVKARILLHNSGKEAVAFITSSFHQPGHKAQLADGSELKLDATDWFTRSLPRAWRLAPGEYIEVNTPGLGIGAHDKERAEWSDVRAGSWILCKVGDEVTLLPGAVMLTSKETPIDPDWWLAFITERLEREAPVPLDTKEREYLLYRVVRELFGTAPSTTEGNAFAADKSPDALKNLAVLLTKHQYGTRCEGSISAGETKFRVLPPDPDADKKPRVAMNPGRYTLGGSTTLVVTRRPDGRRIVNEAHLSYNPPEDTKPAPHHKIELPDGYDTWAAASVRGETVLWLSQKGRLLKIDFTNFGKIQETRYEGEKTDTAPIPADIRQALIAALTVPDAPKQVQEPLKPAAATPASPAASAPALEATEKPKGASVPSRPKLPEDAYAKPGVHFDKFREEDAKRPGGERMGAVLEPSKPEDREKEALVLGVRTASDAQWRIGGTAKVGLVVRNRSDSDVKFSYTGRLDNGISVVAVDEAGKEHGAGIGQFDGLLIFQQMLLPVAHVATIKQFTLRFDAEKRDVSEPHVAAFHLPPGKYKLRCKWNDARPDVTHEGEWTGELVNEELAFTLAAAAAPASETPKTDAPATENPKGAAVKLTPDALLGFWRGTVNEEKLMLSFHRPPVEKDVQLDIYFGEATIGALARFTIAADGGSAAVVQHSAGGGMKFGTLIPGGAGKLKLELYGRQQGQMEVMLTLDAEPAATEPHQKEPRELFAMWKTTANEDGMFPGTFIGALATEVRAYVKANPNLDSGMKLPKLLPRFVTSRDWTRAEAIKLLDDVAYYSTAPIAARVAKAKLPSDALYRTKVEFQDIPVAIAKWSEAKDGLRIGMRVVEGEWRVGGEVNVEMWLHNAGAKDLTLKANPQRSDVGLWVVAKDSEGQDHGAANGNIDILAIPQTCVLPAGHVAKIKSFALTFDAPGNKVQGWMQPRFRELQPGSYKLRCEWSDAERQTGYGPDFSADKFWTGKLTTPEFDFTLVAQDAPKTASERKLPPVDGPPVHPRLADDRYAKVGVPLAEQTWPMPPWGVEKDGLSAGLRVIGDARIGGEVKAELWVRNSGAKDVKLSKCYRADVGLNVVAKDKDGKEHSADITQFRGYPVYSHLLLPPGHGVKVKEFSVKFGAGKNDKLEPGWVNLQLTPGDYKLRAVWSDTTSRGAAEGEWTGKLTTGEVDLKIAAANKVADARKPGAKPPGANIVKVPDDQYVKSGFPVDELAGEGVMWNDVGDGLLLGYRITGDEWRILGKDVKVELWVQNPGDKEVKFQLNMRPDIGLRMAMKGEKGAEHESNIVPSSSPPFGEHRLLPPGHALKVKEFTVSLLWPENDVSGIKGHYFAIDPGAHNFHCELELPGISATGEGGKQLTPAAGEWTGKLTTRGLNVVVIAPDAPAPKPRVEHVRVRISKDGEVSLDRKKMSLDELKTRAARNAKKWFTIEADEDVPCAKVIEVVEALKAVGVTEFSFAEARVGDGKYRVAKRQASYKLDEKHHFSICRPSDYPQFFTVSWPAEGERPACWLRTYPNVSEQTQGKWAVVWEPGTDVLWWVDDSDVGKMTLTDPAHVIVDREGRMNNFSRDFGLPNGVMTEFRRLGFAVGRIGQTGPDIGGNTGGQSIVSAEARNWIVEGTVTDADGKPKR